MFTLECLDFTFGECPRASSMLRLTQAPENVGSNKRFVFLGGTGGRLDRRCETPGPSSPVHTVSLCCLLPHRERRGHRLQAPRAGIAGTLICSMDHVGNISTRAASVAKTTAPGASIGSSAKTEPSSLSGVRSTTRASKSPLERSRNPWRPRGDAASAAALVSIDIAAKNHIDLQMVTGSKPILYFSTRANINLRGYPGAIPPLLRRFEHPCSKDFSRGGRTPRWLRDEPVRLHEGRPGCWS